MTLTGWGTTKEGDRNSVANILQEVDIPVISNADCKEDLSDIGYGKYVHNTSICASAPEGGKDSCQGDSGGPGVWINSDSRAFQIAVVSWGIGCGRIGRPGIYARLTKYLDWIEKNTGESN